MKVKVEDLIAAIEEKVEARRASLAEAEAKDQAEFEKWKPKALTNAKKYVEVLSKKTSTYDEVVEAQNKVSGYWSRPARDGEWAREELKRFEERAKSDIKMLKMAAEATINVGVSSQFNYYL